MTNEKDGPPVVTDSRCDCANTQGNHEIVCPYWPLSLNGDPRLSPEQHVHEWRYFASASGVSPVAEKCDGCGEFRVIPPGGESRG